MSFDFSNADGDNLALASSPVTAVPISVSVWFKPDDTGADTQGLVYMDDDPGVGNAPGEEVYVSYSPTNTQISSSATAESGTQTLNVSDTANRGGLARGGWVHVLLVVESDGTITHYVNGTFSAASTFSAGTTFSSLARLRIGEFQTTGGTSSNSFDGLIGEVAIWTRDMSTEAVHLYDGLRPTLEPDGLVFYQSLRGEVNGHSDIGSDVTNTGAGANADHPPVRHGTPPVILAAMAGIGR